MENQGDSRTQTREERSRLKTLPPSNNLDLFHREEEDLVHPQLEVRLAKTPSNEKFVNQSSIQAKHFKVSTLKKKKKSFLCSPANLFDRQPQNMKLVERVQKNSQKEDFNILNFLEEISKSPTLKSYSNFQILVHIKGRPYIDSYLYNFQESKSVERTHAKNFNAIFKTIKKSKNRHFDQAQLLRSEIKTTGTFIAKEIGYKSFSLIFIISRSEFFPPNDNEKRFFDTFCDAITPSLGLIVEREVSKKDTELFKEIFCDIPFPIRLKKQDQVVFQNYSHLVPNSPIEVCFDNQYSLQVEIQRDELAPEIHHSQRILLLGELLNTLRHELSNPLFGLHLSSDLLLSEDSLKAEKSTVQEISNYTHHCENVLENFSNLYKKESFEKTVHLKEVVKQTIMLTKSMTKEIRKSLHIDDNIYITTNPTLLSQILFNSILNSAQAIQTSNKTNAHHEITISSELNSHSVLIKVCDTGDGISQESQEKIFKPFYTTKLSGTGLGLSICSNLALKLGGSFKLEESSQNGTCFVLELKHVQNSSD